MAVAEDGNGYTTQLIDSYFESFSHTCSGDDRLLIVAFAFYPARTIVAVTYNSVAMTQLDVQGGAGNEYVYIYYMVNPPTGANTVYMELNTGANGGIMATSFTGVDQTTPLGTHSKATDNSQYPLTAALTGTSSDIFIDACSFYSKTATPNSGQTQKVNINDSSEYLCVSTEPGSASSTMGWDLGSAYNGWVTIGVPIKAAGAAASIIAQAHHYRNNSGSGL